jgi:hypothetical protein
MAVIEGTSEGDLKEEPGDYNAGSGRRRRYRASEASSRRRVRTAEEPGIPALGLSRRRPY